MGKLLNDMWQKYCDEGYATDDIRELMVFNIKIKEILKALPQEALDEIENIRKSQLELHKRFEHDAFVEGVKRGCLMMLDKM